MNIGKLSKLWMLLISILFCFSESKAENNLIFDHYRITSSGINMPYRVAHVNGNGTPSLIIYLHGGSSKGNDNETQMQEAGIDSIADYLEKRQIEAYFIVPQCPSDKSWGGPMLGLLKSLIDKYVDNDTVDRNNLFIFGGSMGGTGTWSMLSAYPALFTAAMPVAGNPSKCDASKVAATPVYTVMGTADQIMSVETTADFISELNAHNGITEFDIEEGWTHEMTCIQSYTTERLDWVFKYNNNTSSVENRLTNDQTIVKTIYYSLDGRILSGQPAQGTYILQRIKKDGTTDSLKIVK